jgi:chemotaxis response regulator CheB
MVEKRVLLVESGHFIGGVIYNLFQQHDQLRIIETSPVNTAELITVVEKHRPHIVVLDDTVDEAFLSRLLGYMQNSGDFRVVVVDTNSNRISIYQKQQINVHRTADLFAIL